MTVSVDAVTKHIRTDTASPQTFSHAGAASGVKGVLLSLIHGNSSTDHVSAASYGGVAMTRVQRNTDTAGEPGAAEWWFLGAGVPQGTQDFSYTPGGTTDDIFAEGITLLGSADLEVVDSDGVSEDATNPSVTLGYGGRTCMAFGSHYSGNNDPANILPNANCTTIDSHDFGTWSGKVFRQTTAGTADFDIGSTISDDTAFAAVAISEVAGGTTYTKDMLDAVAVADGQYLGRERGRHRSETIATVGDFQYLSRERGRSMPDAVELVVDSQFLSRVRGRVMFDAVELLDLFAKVITGGPQVYVKVFTDEVTVAEGLVLARYRNRHFAEVVVVDDSGVQRFFTIEVGDRVDLTDAAVLARLRNRIKDEGVQPVDQAIRTREYGRASSDALGVTDNQALSRHRGRVVSEAVQVADEQVRFRLLFRDLVDAITVLDVIDYSVVRAQVPMTVEVRVRLGWVDPVRLGNDDAIKLGGYN